MTIADIDHPDYCCDPARTTDELFAYFSQYKEAPKYLQLSDDLIRVNCLPGGPAYFKRISEDEARAIVNSGSRLAHHFLFQDQIARANASVPSHESEINSVLAASDAKLAKLEAEIRGSER
jgi:hypothetical protein